MRMLSGNLHWLTVGLALLVSAGRVHGQTGIPLKPAGMAQGKKTSVQPASYMQGAAPGYEMMAPGMPMGSPGGEMPMHMAMQGPPPMDVAMEQGAYCDSGVGCDSMGGGLFGRGLTGCGYCGGSGCGFCGAGNGCLGSGALLGILAPYSEGGRGAQRWFDISVGTIALTRSSNTGPFQSAVQDIQTGVFLPATALSTNGVNGPVVLRSTDVDASKTRFGLEVIANLQTGPGAQIEARYFGLNKWNDSRTARLVPFAPDLFSVFSLFGTDPVNGFDDTDRSFTHTVTLESSLNSGEVSYKRFFGMPTSWLQGAWQAGVRYVDIDERFGFAAVGSNNNAFQFNQLRFFNMDTRTRNQLTGFQVGGELWANLVPGLMVGAQGKGGVYGNHAEVESAVVANSIAGARDFLQDGRTAYVTEFIASTVYRLNYSWSFRGSYNLLYVDNIALAQENFNPRDLSNAIGQGNYTANRVTYLNTDGEAFYHGFTLAGEWAY